MIEFRLNLPFTYLCTHCLRVCACVCVCVCIHTYLFFFSFVCSLDENSTRCAERSGGRGNRSWGVCGRLCDRQAGRCSSFSLSLIQLLLFYQHTHTHTLPFARCLFVLRAVFYCLWYCWRVVVVVVALVVIFVAAPLPCCCSVRSF